MDANDHNKTAAGRPLRLPTEVSQEQLAEIVGLLKGLRYGSVHIIVQDGVIVQIDRTEKKRIVRNNSSVTESRES